MFLQKDRKDKKERTMKTKIYDYHDWTFKAYYKPCGNGYEVGVYCGTKPVFVGNFINKTEATRWYNLMNRNMKTFFKKYNYPTMPSKTWYCQFFANNMYTVYYKFLDKVFAKYNKTYYKAYETNVKYFNKYKKENYYYGKTA